MLGQIGGLNIGLNVRTHVASKGVYMDEQLIDYCALTCKFLCRFYKISNRAAFNLRNMPE